MHQKPKSPQISNALALSLMPKQSAHTYRLSDF